MNAIGACVQRAPEGLFIVIRNKQLIKNINQNDRRCKLLDPPACRVLTTRRYTYHEQTFG